MYGGWHDYQQWADHDFRPRASFDAFAEAVEDETPAPDAPAPEPADAGEPPSADEASDGDYDGEDDDGYEDAYEGEYDADADGYDGEDEDEGEWDDYDADGYDDRDAYDETDRYDQAEHREPVVTWDEGEGELTGTWQDTQGALAGDYAGAPTDITMDPLPTGLPVRSDEPVHADPLLTGPVFTSDSFEWPDEDGDLYLDSTPMVRPYARTGGRTKSKYDLRLETLLSTMPDPTMDYRRLAGDHEQICRLCEVSRSTAEVSAKLSIPLGVAKVLIGDVVDMGLVIIHESEAAPGDRPSFMLMQRVLSGLQRL